MPYLCSLKTDDRKKKMEEVKRNSLQAWILAARPKTLAGAITPVMIGCALAFATEIQLDTGIDLLFVRRTDAGCRQFHQRFI